MDLTKDQILTAAEDCFSKYGYQGATIAQIAHSAGVNPATIYRFFDGKKELFDALHHPELDFPAPQHTEQQRQIIAAALKVFSLRGFGAATMDEIAECAGLSKSSLYTYFSSKETLFNAVVEDPPLLVWMEPVLEQIEANPLLDFESSLALLGERYLAAFDDAEIVQMIRLLLSEGLRSRRLSPPLLALFARKGARRMAQVLAGRAPVCPEELPQLLQLYFGMLLSWALLNHVFVAPDGPTPWDEMEPAPVLAVSADLSASASKLLARRAARIFLHGLHGNGLPAPSLVGLFNNQNR